MYLKVQTDYDRQIVECDSFKTWYEDIGNNDPHLIDYIDYEFKEKKTTIQIERTCDSHVYVMDNDGRTIDTISYKSRI